VIDGRLGVLLVERRWRRESVIGFARAEAGVVGERAVREIGREPGELYGRGEELALAEVRLAELVSGLLLPGVSGKPENEPLERLDCGIPAPRRERALRASQRLASRRSAACA
jgi:hypothetical protein